LSASARCAIVPPPVSTRDARDNGADARWEDFEVLIPTIPLQVVGEADALPALILDWQVPRSLRECASPQSFRRDVVEELGRDPFIEAPGSATAGALRVEARRSGGRITVELRYAPPGAAAPLRITPGSVPSGRCGVLLTRLAGELRDVLAPRPLSLVVSVEPPARPPETRPATPSAAPTETSLSVAIARAELSGVEGHRESHDTTLVTQVESLTNPTQDGPRDSTSWSGRVSVLGGVTFSEMPGIVAPSVSVGVTLQRRRLGLTANATAELPPAQSATCDGASVGSLSMQRVQVDLGPCLALPHVSLCAGALGRVVHARAEGLDESGPVYQFQVGGFLRAEVRVALSRTVDAIARVEGSAASEAPFSAKDQSRSVDCPVASTGFFTAGASIGLAFGLW
jgi:hypothetical protein